MADLFDVLILVVPAEERTFNDTVANAVEWDSLRSDLTEEQASAFIFEVGSIAQYIEPPLDTSGTLVPDTEETEA